MKKRVVVLGANGQLGQALITQAPHDNILPLTRKDFNLYKSEDFDILINATAYNHTEKAEEERELAFKINAEEVLEMARASQKRDATFVHVSTDFVFDGKKRGPYSETDKTNPLSTYGLSKLEGEKNGALSKKYYIFRTASLFGNSPNNFVQKIIALAKTKESLQVIDDITMSPTSAKDLAEWIYKCIDCEAPHGIYHAVNSGSATWHTFAKEIVNLAGLKTEILPCPATFYPSKIKRPMYSVLNNNKISSQLGPIRGWEEALQEYIHEQF